MFILSKNGDQLVKPVSIWTLDDIKWIEDEKFTYTTILMNDGRKTFEMGTYEKKYAQIQINRIMSELNSNTRAIKMFTDEDIKKFK